MRLLIAAALVLMLAGCGTLSGPRTGTVSPPTDALARWSDFPADQLPRPIVLLGSPGLASGLASDDAKRAIACGKFRLSFQPPAAVPKDAIAVWPDGSRVMYPAISASDALALKPPSAQASSCSAVSPLEFTAARFVRMAFQTDRGMAQMSAWILTAGALDLAQPAIARGAFWKLGSVDPSIGGGALLDPTGRVIGYSFIGGPPDGPCAVNYTGVVGESPHAVAIAVQSSPGRVKAGPNACTAQDNIRAVTIRLANPLGGRVVVDASGAAVPVCAEALRTSC